MSSLPDDMSRLCGEIRDLHSGHAGFLNELKASVAGIKSEVSQMNYGFRQSREEIAEKTSDDLIEQYNYSRNNGLEIDVYQIEEEEQTIKDIADAFSGNVLEKITVPTQSS